MTRSHCATCLVLVALSHAEPELRSIALRDPARRAELEATRGPLKFWDVSEVTNMSGLFMGLEDFDEDLSAWNVSAVEDMSYMFYGCKSFNQPIGTWDTARVRDMSWMFAGATSFNQAIGGWSTSSVVQMQGMFQGALSFDQEIGRWTTDEVQNMSHMFHGAERFDGALGMWNTSQVKDMKYMFFDAHEFKQPLSTWDFRSVDATFLDKKFSMMKPCLLWSATQSHTLPADLRTLWSLMRCPSCAADCAGMACVQGTCRPVNSGYVELGLAKWASHRQLPLAARGFRACAEACDAAECSGFLLEESGQCSLMAGAERLGEGRTAAFMRATCETFACPSGSVRRGGSGAAKAFECCECLGQTVANVEAYPELQCQACPEASVVVDDVCEECAFPFMHLHKTCTLWYWPIVLLLLLLCSGVSLRLARQHWRKRHQEVEKLWRSVEEELWEGVAKPSSLKALGAAGEVQAKLQELRARQSRCAGVSLSYLLADFGALVRQRAGEGDHSFEALEQSFWRGKDRLGEEVICPRDGRPGCALVDWLSHEHRKMQTHYLSYASSSTLMELQGALSTWLPAQVAYFCMCFFVTNHFRPFAVDSSCERLRRCGRMVVLLSTWQRPAYFSRSYCLHELHTALSVPMPVSFVLPEEPTRSLAEQLAPGDAGLRVVTRNLCRRESRDRGVTREVQQAIGAWIGELLHEKFEDLVRQVSEECVGV